MPRPFTDAVKGLHSVFVGTLARDFALLKYDGNQVYGMHPMHPVLASNRYLPFTSKLMAATANAVVDSLVEMGFPKDKA